MAGILSRALSLTGNVTTMKGASKASSKYSACLSYSTDRQKGRNSSRYLMPRLIRSFIPGERGSARIDIEIVTFNVGCEAGAGVAREIEAGNSRPKDNDRGRCQAE